VPAIREWNRNSVRGNIIQAASGISDEAFRSLFAIGHDGRTGGVHPRNGILNSGFVM